jgi:hypothetical protein
VDRILLYTINSRTVLAQLTVHSPLGFPPKVMGKSLAPGLPTLNDRKLFLVDVGFENSDNFMVQLRDWLGEHHPRVKTEVVRWHDQHKPDPELCTRIKAEGDAAILGVGL